MLREVVWTCFWWKSCWIFFYCSIHLEVNLAYSHYKYQVTWQQQDHVLRKYSLFYISTILKDLITIIAFLKCWMYSKPRKRFITNAWDTIPLLHPTFQFQRVFISTLLSINLKKNKPEKITASHFKSFLISIMSSNLHSLLNTSI